MSEITRERSALLFAAEEAERSGQDAREHWARAAQAETNLLFTVDESRPRTRGILGVSAASLWQRAGRPDQVRSVALAVLEGQPAVRDVYAEELRALVEWANEREAA